MRSRQPRKRWSLAWGVGALGFFSAYAHADQFAYGVGYLGEYSDNITLAPTDPQSDWINSAILGIAYLNNGPDVAAQVRAQAQYRDYQNNVYPDGPLYYVDGAAIWNILPQTLSWSVTDRYDQLTADVTLPNTPNNWVNTNALSTGPDAFLHFGHRNTLVLGARYGAASFSDHQFDNSRAGGYANWVYAQTQELSYSINYQYQDVRYDNDVLNDNFIRNEYFVRADWRHLQDRFQFDIGTTRIEPQHAASVDGPTIRFQWTQRLSSDSTASILLGKDFLDSGLALLGTAYDPNLPSSTPPPTLINIASTGDFYTVRRAVTVFQYRPAGMSVTASAAYQGLDYWVTPQDRNESDFRLDYAYNPQGTLSTSLFGEQHNTSYQDFYRNDREYIAGIAFNYRATQEISAVIGAARHWRNSTDPLAEFTANIVSLSLVYASTPQLTPVNPIRRQ